MELASCKREHMLDTPKGKLTDWETLPLDSLQSESDITPQGMAKNQVWVGARENEG